MSAHIVIVDDDADLRDTVSDYLEAMDFRVSSARNGAEMRRVLSQAPVDLVILDLNLPGEDGFSLIPHVRGASRAGIIMLTGSGERVNEVVGLELGADDYVAKPCEMRHLVARVRAVLRRTSAAAASEGPAALRFEGWTLDLAARRLTSPARAEVPLTTAEFECLKALAGSPNRVLSRDRLLQSIHDREWGPYDRAIDNLISRLRRKLNDDPKQPALIKSVRGVGYVFTAKVGQAAG